MRPYDPLHIHLYATHTNLSPSLLTHDRHLTRTLSISPYPKDPHGCVDVGKSVVMVLRVRRLNIEYSCRLLTPSAVQKQSTCGILVHLGELSDGRPCGV